VFSLYLHQQIVIDPHKVKNGRYLAYSAWIEGIEKAEAKGAW
jgi:hypothetical protein